MGHLMEKLPSHIEQIISEVQQWVKEWPKEVRTDFFTSLYRNDEIKYHHSLGLHIRNHFDLWSYPWTPEIRDGVDYSPYHPDELSMTIIRKIIERGPNYE